MIELEKGVIETIAPSDLSQLDELVNRLGIDEGEWLTGLINEIHSAAYSEGYRQGYRDGEIDQYDKTYNVGRG